MAIIRLGTVREKIQTRYTCLCPWSMSCSVQDMRIKWRRGAFCFTTAWWRALATWRPSHSIWHFPNRVLSKVTNKKYSDFLWWLFVLQFLNEQQVQPWAPPPRQSTHRRSVSGWRSTPLCAQSCAKLLQVPPWLTERHVANCHEQQQAKQHRLSPPVGVCSAVRAHMPVSASVRCAHTAAHCERTTM